MKTQISSERLAVSGRVSEAASILANGVLRARRRHKEEANTISGNRLDSSPNSSINSTNPSARGEQQ